MGLASEKWIFFAAGPDERSDIGSPLFYQEKSGRRNFKGCDQKFNEKYEP